MRLTWAIVTLLLITQWYACKEDEEEPEVIASFTSAVDPNDFMTINFTNESTGYETLSWNFGDNSAASSEENPSHTYPDLGTYTVTLTATNGGVTDSFQADVTITDPNAELTKLVGDESKTWKLLRETTTNRYPLQVGPLDYSSIWWAMGLGNDALAQRPCMLNDEWTFFRNGDMHYRANGDYWAEQNVFDPSDFCASTADPMIAKTGEDVSAWGDGDHTFELIPGEQMKLKAIGNGAFIGHLKVGSEYEVFDTDPMVQNEVIYNVMKLTDDNVDTLIVQVNYKPAGAATSDRYWRYTLVHYDNPAEEPPIPGNKPSASFDMVVDGYTITCTNTSSYGDSYLWDFGDGTTETSTDVTHTYTNDGFYNISLTATNANGTSTATQTLWLDDSSPALTDELLQGAPWKVVVGEKTIFVGPGMGSPDWWAVPKKFLTGEGTGGDDWSCMVDDEFTFTAGGVYTYDGKGLVRNDGYLGPTNGCVDETTLTGNSLYFASGTHTYTFTPAAGDARAIILLTNGPDRAAFIGFYKGYYGGENFTSADPPNGGNLTNQYEVMGYAVGAEKEYLFVTVDISDVHDSSKSWSVILER
jgi:PKD repeat protein